MRRNSSLKEFPADLCSISRRKSRGSPEGTVEKNWWNALSNSEYLVELRRNSWRNSVDILGGMLGVTLKEFTQELWRYSRLSSVVSPRLLRNSWRSFGKNLGGMPKSTLKYYSEEL